jgi:predicted DNA-binding WGR domain protein
MGWEIKNNQFFCNTSDEFFGPYLDESIWPDHDNWCLPVKDELFHQLFNKYLRDNPQKRAGARRRIVDPRSMTDQYLEEIVGQFEDLWLRLVASAEDFITCAKDLQLNTIETLNKFGDELDFTPKVKATKKKATKKKATKKKATKKKATKKKATKKKATKKKAATKKTTKKKLFKKSRISSWKRYEFSDEKSAKFWEVRKVGQKYSVRYGKIGTTGQEKSTMMESGTRAEMKVANMIDSKLKKGYKLV